VQVELEKQTITKDIAVKYLSLYVGDADWSKHIDTLWARLARKHGEAQAKVLLKKTIACATMLPVYDRTKIPDNPENLLFWCPTYQQFNEKDWTEIFLEIVNKDEQIEGWRLECQRLGVVYPIVYAPWPRQAFNWLFKAAEESHQVTEENREQVEKRFERLVLTYGGLVICHIFQKEEYKIKKKVLNWRTGYFFERLIFDIYTIDQVLKIKKQELLKTNKTLVKQIQN
jgi:hypothetical protein